MDSWEHTLKEAEESRYVKDISTLVYNMILLLSGMHCTEKEVGTCFLFVN